MFQVIKNTSCLDLVNFDQQNAIARFFFFGALPLLKCEKAQVLRNCKQKKVNNTIFIGYKYCAFTLIYHKQTLILEHVL